MCNYQLSAMKRNISTLPSASVHHAGDNSHSPGCPVRKAMEIVGGKWKLFIIQQLGTGMMRYGDLKRAIPDISEKMLIQELKSLVDLGILEKKSFGEIPPRVEYRLTQQGKKALPLLEHIKAFGEAMME